MEEVVIVGAARTAIGKFSGALARSLANLPDFIQGAPNQVKGDPVPRPTETLVASKLPRPG